MQPGRNFVESKPDVHRTIAGARGLPPALPSSLTESARGVAGFGRIGIASGGRR